MQFGRTLLAAGAQVGCVAFVSGLIDGATLEWCERGHWAGGPRRPTSHSEIKAPPSVRCMWLKEMRNSRFFGNMLPAIQPNYPLKSRQTATAPLDSATLALPASNPGTVTFLGDVSDFPRNVFKAIVIQNARCNLTAPLKSPRRSESQFCVRRIRVSNDPADSTAGA